MTAPDTGPLVLDLPDEAATARLGEDIAAVLRPGDLVALSGGLGAGKTSLARALIRAVASDPQLEAPSPTFPIRIDHDLPRFKIVHADLYRLGGAADLDEIGLDEAVAEGAVLVEWPEALPPDLSPERLDVALAFAGSGRRAMLVPSGTWRERLARSLAVRSFLDRSGWAGAARAPLAGDASARAYERVSRAGTAAIVMNAPARPEGPALEGGKSYDEIAHRARDVTAFVAIAKALREAGVRAPAVHAADFPSGLLLLEDLGSEGIVAADWTPLMERYEAAIDLLVHMHRLAWPGEIGLPDGRVYRVPSYDRGALLVEVSLFPDWFGGAGGEPAFPPGGRADFLATWSQLLDTIEDGPKTLVLRDYHSPNILWQGGEAGIGRVGVLDFQDALLGHPAYDVASLAQDARVPLSPEQEDALKSRYVAARRSDPGFDRRSFETAYAVLGVQRATKVLGAFNRLALAEGKPGYQRHRERLKALLSRSLADPVLSPLRVWYEPYLQAVRSTGG